MPFDSRLINGIGVLAAVIQSRNFTRAGETVGMSQSGVSKAVSRLEDRLGVRLLDRTSQEVTLTDKGRQFFEHVSPLLGVMEEAADHLSGAIGTVRGRLRICADPLISRLFLAPAFAEFLDRYPELEIELLTDKSAEPIPEGIDVQFYFGEPTSSALIARRILETRIVTVAAPAYLHHRGSPEIPSDLVSHTCIAPASTQNQQWIYSRNREVVPVITKGPLVLTDVDSLVAACLSGAGIAQVLEIGVQHLLNEGKLVRLLTDWPGDTIPLHAVHPTRHLRTPKVSAYIDFCLERMR
ncbi:DNA-binding transcriptional LysR family regulator [Phyllobacterium trifolii]|uniref:DNA-binding transcriptional LysR family regulator n=1 Tax=Phyllobacterium trifolii TaxID=300193 RepID=A0A839UF32_9HYPH|nr:LysR family transcriptional regulator [Phyllobacterium trifolii]MBB3149748.1 DNA-binding transcriptional LysR family regulator [Phyllobacterium trifolii]